MAHVRKSIRDDIVTTLTGLATTGSRVYRTKVYPISSGSLPALVIYTKNETSEYISMSIPRTIERTVTIAVEAYVQGNSNYDNTLDAIAAEVEDAITADVTRSGYARDTRVASFDADFSGDPDQPVAYATITLEVDYVTIEQSPEVAA